MSDLAQYHNKTVRQLNANEAEPNEFDPEQGIHYDACNELAITLLTDAGYKYGDLDDGKVQINDEVETLLTLALFRAPQLREYMELVHHSMNIDKV